MGGPRREVHQGVAVVAMFLLCILAGATTTAASPAEGDPTSESSASNGNESAQEDPSMNTSDTLNGTAVLEWSDFDCDERPAEIGDWVQRGASQYPVKGSPEWRPDMPSGDVVKRLHCWLSNPYAFNITVAAQSPDAVEVFDPTLEICWMAPDLNWYYTPPISWYFSIAALQCETGQWDPEYTLQQGENITFDWVLYSDSRSNPLPEGQHVHTLGAKIVGYGDNKTTCPNCSTVTVTSTHQVGAWHVTDWHGYLAFDPSLCQDTAWVKETNRYCFAMPTMVQSSGWVGHFTPHPLSACTTTPRYGEMQWRWYTVPTQEVTICEAQFSSTYAELFQASNLQRAKLLSNHDVGLQSGDYIHWEWDGWNDDLNAVPSDMWEDQRCPTDSFETVIYPSIIGNQNPRAKWDAEIRVHQYDFDRNHWTTSTLMERSYQSSTYTGYDAEQSRFNVDVSTLDENGLLLFDWVVYENGTEVAGDVIGECLTADGVDYMETLIRRAQVTTGESGNPVQRAVNTMAFELGINAIVFTCLAMSFTVLGGRRIQQGIQRKTIKPHFLVALVFPPLFWSGLYATLGEPCYIWCGDDDWNFPAVFFLNLITLIGLAAMGWVAHRNKAEGQQPVMSSIALGFLIGSMLAMFLVGTLLEPIFS